jgi:hypothetical protein
MTEVECPREHELLETIAAGRWPDATDATLMAHVPSCTVCSEMVLVAGALRGNYDHVCAAAHVPPAGLVWWRAQLRARREIAGTAARPITYAHALTGAVAAGLFFTLGGLLWPWLRASLDWIDAASRLADVGRLWVPFALAVGAWLILAPVVLFLVLSEE